VAPVEAEEHQGLANRLTDDGPATIRLACRAQPIGDVTVLKEGVASAAELDPPTDGRVERPEDVLRRASVRSAGRLQEEPMEPGGRFPRLPDLTDPEILRDVLDRLGQTRYLERLGQSRPLNEPGVVGSNFLKDIVFDLVFVEIGLWARERRA